MAKKIIKGVGKAALGTVGSIIGGKLLGSKKKAAPEPGPIVMPIADDEATKAARKRSIATQMKRGGRSSTILTGDGGTTLGGY